MRRAPGLAALLGFALACGGGREERMQPPTPEMMPPPTPIVMWPDTAKAEREEMQPAEPAPAGAAADTAMAPAAEMAPPQEEPAPDLGPGTIGPGFTERHVRQVLGDPLYTSGYGEHTFYFYDNGREKEVGFLDFVIFRAGRVVDAVFRHPQHRYAGVSSSPRGVTPKPTPGGEELVAPPAPPPDTLPPPR